MSSTYNVQNAILNLMFGRTATSASPPTTWYLGLATEEPNQSTGSAAEISSSGDSWYARKGVANTSANFTYQSGLTGARQGEIKMITSASFPVCNTDWGTITHVLFYDAATSGCMWFWSALDTPIEGDIGKRIEFAGNQIIIRNNNTG